MCFFCFFFHFLCITYRKNGVKGKERTQQRAQYLKGLLLLHIISTYRWVHAGSELEFTQYVAVHQREASHCDGKVLFGDVCITFMEGVYGVRALEQLPDTGESSGQSNSTLWSLSKMTSCIYFSLINFEGEYRRTLLTYWLLHSATFDWNLLESDPTQHWIGH